MRWPWQIRAERLEKAARQAKVEAIGAMGQVEDSLARRREVQAKVDISRKLRADNHFAEAIRNLMQGRAS